MFIHCNLAILILALSLNGQVRAGEIIGGNKAEHRKPYMVLLEQRGENNSQAYCGAFLLNKEFVMTAAHCQARSYNVLLGLHNFSHKNGVKNVSVEKSFIHEKYNAIGYKNDIMLLKLSSKAHFTEHVKPIALAEQSDDSKPESCMIFGWGKTNKNNEYLSPILMEANINLTEECLRENSYCSKGKIGPGPGDSGGPLVCGDGEAYGVVSANYATHPGGPEIHAYVKIPDYRDWIDSTMKNASKSYM